MTQTQQIQTHLVKHGGITSLEAIQLYGITRLSARIWELKKSGMEILSRDVAVKNWNGDTIRVTRYSLPE